MRGFAIKIVGYRKQANAYVAAPATMRQSGKESSWFV
jgi:pectin methylesterase-like acyl-CoA thioesterase